MPNDEITYTLHGAWNVGNRKISYMWLGSDGKMYYEDVPEVREKKLDIRKDPINE